MKMKRHVGWKHNNRAYDRYFKEQLLLISVCEKKKKERKKEGKKENPFKQIRREKQTMSTISYS